MYHPPGLLVMAIANNEKDLFSLILHHKHDFNPNSPGLMISKFLFFYRPGQPNLDFQKMNVLAM